MGLLDIRALLYCVGQVSEEILDKRVKSDELMFLTANRELYPMNSPSFSFQPVGV